MKGWMLLTVLCAAVAVLAVACEEQSGTAAQGTNAQQAQRAAQQAAQSAKAAAAASANALFEQKERILEQIGDAVDALEVRLEGLEDKATQAGADADVKAAIQAAKDKMAALRTQITDAKDSTSETFTKVKADLDAAVEDAAATVKAVAEKLGVQEGEEE